MDLPTPCIGDSQCHDQLMSLNVLSLRNTTRSNEELFALRSSFEADPVPENASTGNESNMAKSKHMDEHIAFSMRAAEVRMPVAKVNQNLRESEAMY